ncbi:PTS sugar transporter subunit IIA [Oceanobacillus neutriphilus]|uniref:PTS fructose transporter subunit IIA n=1 Tax=Oceanobacillus neutriphilus TaxID=531815 RepID=A0ABQ2NVT8_9BACI|nr:PTS sugar transporter subunit IIA [Oceanobacillus neutriphilus]GGP11806.1 PTS fructose transporter subunit IIA [Oceanobacillus neutriphilus]
MDISIENFLDEKIMGVDLEAETKDDAIQVLSKMLLNEGYINNIDDYKKDIYYRESLGTTGIGNYIAIPHGKSEGVYKNGIAIGKFKNEIPWETLDDKGVKIVCLFAVRDEEGGSDMHLKLLASIAGKLGNDNVVENLLNATSVIEMTNILS